MSFAPTTTNLSLWTTISHVDAPVTLNDSSTQGLDSTWTGVSQALRPIFLLVVACIGLVGNALNLLVLRSYHTTQITYGGECTARVNLLGLALADFLVCLTSLPLGYVQRRHRFYSFMLFYTIIGPGLVTYFLAVSVWMVLLMSIVRYMAVCHPLASRAWLTSRHMCRVIVFIYVVGFIFHIPSLLMFTYGEESDLERNSRSKCTHSTNTSDLQLNQSTLCAGPTAILVFERPFWRSETVDVTHHVIHIILTNIGPFLGVVVSNIAVIRACRRSDECRRTGTFVPIQETGKMQQVHSSPIHIPYSPSPLNGGCPADDCAPSALRIRAPALLLLHNPSSIPCRVNLHRYPSTATNRVTPLLLAVIIAFLLFTAPFGIVHFVCLQLMRNLGVRVRDNRQARRLYTALNLTVEWTNVVQLLSCASNFFLYFLVSTIFRRTTKRTFRRLYKQIRGCRSDLLMALFTGRRSNSLDSWEQDSRTHELRRALDVKINSNLSLPSDMRPQLPRKRPATAPGIEKPLTRRPNRFLMKYTHPRAYPQSNSLTLNMNHRCESCSPAVMSTVAHCAVACPHGCPLVEHECAVDRSRGGTASCSACPHPYPSSTESCCHLCRGPTPWTMAINSEPQCCMAHCPGTFMLRARSGVSHTSTVTAPACDTEC